MHPEMIVRVKEIIRAEFMAIVFGNRDFSKNFLLVVRIFRRKGLFEVIRQRMFNISNYNAVHKERYAKWYVKFYGINY